MTAAQKDAFFKAREILKEHFASSVMFVQYDNEEDDNREGLQWQHHGGYTAAVGLVEVGRRRMLQSTDGESEDVQD